ncbi:MAG TPA: phosphoserine phosphatase SerB [Acetobacteraceae bacterium]|nr:phosphoserine phosphatase SerB [Acetobacteraceae bacterium]
MTHILTLVAARHATSLAANLIAQIRDMTGGGAMTQLSPGEAADIVCATAPDLDQIREIVAGAPIDAIAMPAEGRRKRILIADMDSTIITGETLDELAAHAGVGEKIAAITARAMNGELDFQDALRERVAMLKGLSVAALERTWQGVRLTPGALELVATMKAHGAFTALVSGGFSFFTSRVAARAGFDMHRSNTLLDDGTTLSGLVAEPILDRSVKLATLHEVTARHGLPLAAALATGDGANDLDMLQAAGLGVAFHAKPIVAAATQARVDHADLRALLFAQGYPASAFASVD